MKKLIVLLIVLSSCIEAFCQENPEITKRLKENYSSVFFNRNYNWYRIRKGSVNEKGNIGACDKTGRLIMPPIWDDVQFWGDCFTVKKDGKVGIRDLQNKEIIPCTKYTYIQWSSDKKQEYFFVAINEKKGVIDRNNKEIVPCNYDRVALPINDNKPYCKVWKHGKIGIFDVDNGYEVMPCAYDDVKKSYSSEDGSLWIIKSGEKVGAYDIKERLELIPCIYDEIPEYYLRYRPFCRVEKNGKAGIYDTKERRERIAPKYDQIFPRGFLSGDYGLIELDGKDGLVDIDGKDMLSCGKYKYLKYYGGHYVCVSRDIDCQEDEYGDIIKIKKKGKYGVYDCLQQKEIIPCKYDYIGRECEGLFAFNTGGVLYVDDGNLKIKKGKWGYIDIHGTEIIPSQYEEVSVFEGGVAQVTKDGVTSIITNPLTGTNLQVKNGNAKSIVDANIPLTKKNEESTFAFIIANENYTHFSGADYSINDGKIFAEYCKKTLGIPDKNVRYYEDATYGNIVNAVKKLNDIADVYEGDAKIIFYYSGLGAVDEKSQEKCLLAADASMAALKNTGYSVSMLMEILNGLNVNMAWVILDAPFSNMDKTGKSLLSSRGIAIKSKTVTPHGNVVLTEAGESAQTVFSSKQLGHSLLTYCLLEKLQNSGGKCTLQELSTYATTQTKKLSMKEFDKIQAPITTVSENMSDMWNTIKF